MKKEEEVEKSVRETSELVRETREVFVRNFLVYADSLVKGIDECVAKIVRQGGKDVGGVLEELTAIGESTKGPALAMRKHQVKMKRGMRVVLHKNAAHANDRLLAALERIKQEEKDFKGMMEALAKSSRK